MKYTLVFFLVVQSLTAVSQKISYHQWKEDAKTEIRLLPEFGNSPKTPEQKIADQKLIKDELKQEGNSRKASDHLIQLGFNNLYSGDLKTAMFRFNQAWLLDPKNENVYWGYSVIYFSFQDYDEALRQMEKGLAINPNSSSILTDKATIYVQFYQIKNNIDFLNKAIMLFKQSYNIDPLNQNTLFKLSAAYYYKNDCANARRFYEECMKLGGKSISPGYGEALNKLCNK